MLKKTSEANVFFVVVPAMLLMLATSQSVIAGHSTDIREAVSVTRLPLPPTAPSTDTGSCTLDVNSNGTGCLSAGRNGIDGARTFSIDGNHVYVSVTFSGAPAAPDPASIYSGGQLILVKTDDTTFPNGDAWKCVTCGVPAENKVGINNPNDNTYPEAFADGKRVKMGSNILDCGPYDITDPECTSEQTHIYPIRSPFPGFPVGGIMRELRLHPDNIHLGWNQLFFSLDFTAASQFGVFGRLEFNPSPASGPAAYELYNISFLVSPEQGKSGRFFSVAAPGELRFERPIGVIGEFRGFTPDGKSALGIGTQDSFNYDIFATSLSTGESTRLTRDPAYTDPVNISPDGKSMVIMDGRVTTDTGYPGGNPAGTDGRMYFASAGPGVPPLIDLAITEAIGSLYTNASRGSFLQPYLIKLDDDKRKKRLRRLDRNIHDGQALAVEGDPSAGSGSISDPLWLGGADAAWSPDSTAVVYYQRRGCNPEPAPCPPSTEPGGRNARLMIAKFSDRAPSEPLPQTEPVSDIVPWGTPYEVGDSLPPVRQIIPEGNYILKSKWGWGWADVDITEGPSRFNPGLTEVVAVKVTYYGYTSDGLNYVFGTEEGVLGSRPTSQTWYSDLIFIGLHNGTRKSSSEGFTVTSGGLGSLASFSGTLTTTLDGMTFTSPLL